VALTACQCIISEFSSTANPAIILFSGSRIEQSSQKITFIELSVNRYKWLYIFCFCGVKDSAKNHSVSPNELKFNILEYRGFCTAERGIYEIEKSVS
jgi:hypothetical protein